MSQCVILISCLSKNKCGHNRSLCAGLILISSLSFFPLTVSWWLDDENSCECDWQPVSYHQTQRRRGKWGGCWVTAEWWSPRLLLLDPENDNRGSQKAQKHQQKTVTPNNSLHSIHRHSELLRHIPLSLQFVLAHGTPVLDSWLWRYANGSARGEPRDSRRLMEWSVYVDGRDCDLQCGARAAIPASSLTKQTSAEKTLSRRGEATNTESVAALERYESATSPPGGKIWNINRTNKIDEHRIIQSRATSVLLSVLTVGNKSKTHPVRIHPCCYVQPRRWRYEVANI